MYLQFRGLLWYISGRRSAFSNSDPKDETDVQNTEVLAQREALVENYYCNLREKRFYNSLKTSLRFEVRSGTYSKRSGLQYKQFYLPVHRWQLCFLFLKGQRASVSMVIVWLYASFPSGDKKLEVEQSDAFVAI